MEESAKKAASADRKLECGGCPLRIELHEGLMFGKIASTPQPGNQSFKHRLINDVFATINFSVIIIQAAGFV